MPVATAPWTCGWLKKGGESSWLCSISDLSTIRNPTVLKFILSKHSVPYFRLLMQNQSKMLPKSDFACLPCPNSLWFVQNQKELTCFCQMMKVVCWTNLQKNIIYQSRRSICPTLYFPCSSSSHLGTQWPQKIFPSRWQVRGSRQSALHGNWICLA